MREMIEIEKPIAEEFKSSSEQFYGRPEFLSFWLRSQSFFICAKSLTDKSFKAQYEIDVNKNWRFGIKAIRHSFSHDLNTIPTLQSASKFLSKEEGSISMCGFVFREEELCSILRNTSDQAVARDFNKKTNYDIQDKEERLIKDHKQNSEIVNSWISRASDGHILINDIATQHYLKIHALMESTISDVQKYITTEQDSNNGNDFKIDLSNTWLKAIDDTVCLVNSYRTEKCNL
jgi:hypothetical protein